MEGLLPLNQTAQLVTTDLAYHDYEGIALDHDERPRRKKDLGTKNHMLLRNHGTLTVAARWLPPSSACSIWSVLARCRYAPACWGHQPIRSSRRWWTRRQPVHGPQPAGTALNHAGMAGAAAQGSTGSTPAYKN